MEIQPGTLTPGSSVVKNQLKTDGSAASSASG